jgi:uncharacterized PurR-regulated membrane protein YhhQ (DUF165 family)
VATAFQWQKRKFSMKKALFGKLALISAAVVGGSSFAAVDITAATAGISDAQTAVLAVLAVMVTMSAAIFGVRKLLKFIK